MCYIDFHAHTYKAEHKNYSVCSVRINEIEEIEGRGPFTLGIHPWDSLDKKNDLQLDKLKKFVQNPKVIAVGEIGLDRLRGANLDVQTELFKNQVLIAEEAQKPVVIHCVRSFSEIQQLRKTLNPTTPWAIHNFMGNEQIAKSLIKQGFYLSFCIAIAKSQKLCNALNSVPIERVFFETDDFIENVEDVYFAAAKCLKVKTKELVDKVFENYSSFFGVTPQ